MSLRHEARLQIAADHPSLPGHFPGNPVVPGVVLLEAVMDAAEAWLGRPLDVRGLPQVKFPSSLLPDQRARVLLELDSTTLRFRIVRPEDEPDAGRTLCQGIFSLAPEPLP